MRYLIDAVRGRFFAGSDPRRLCMPSSSKPAILR